MKIESARCIACKLPNAIKFMHKAEDQEGYYCNVCFKKVKQPAVSLVPKDPLEAHLTNKELLYNEALETHQWLTEHGISMIQYSDDGKLEGPLGKFYILPLIDRLVLFERSVQESMGQHNG
jgi:hypothetical protein